MKKIFLLLSLLVLGMGSYAQTTAKKDAQKISAEINEQIKELASIVEKTDWSSLQTVLDKTLGLVEKNTGSLVQLIDDLDIKTVVKSLEKIATKVEENIDVEKLEKSADRIGKQFEDVLERKAESIK